jgi:streptomycin 6-kinase
VRLGEPPEAALLAQAWQLRLGEPYERSWHWVAPVTQADGQAAVLKVGIAVPTGPDGVMTGAWPLASEARALQHFAGQGAVRLLRDDVSRGALLLEKAEPGTRLADLVPHADEDATRALVTVMQRLHACTPAGTPVAPVDTGLPALADERDTFASYLEEYEGDDPDNPLPHELVECADRLFADLVASAPAPVVLHGDLHHDNVLRATREPWLAIDPHGFVGDPGYDLGALFYNPDPPDRDPVLLALVEPRVELVADLTGMDGDRVAAWAFVKAMLSELWTWEDGGTVGDRSLDVARLLHPRVR